MIVAALLLAASLDDAQAAFANGAYPEAESLALAAAEPPHAGAALYLAALARFRAGRAADALEALDAAAKAADPPEAPLWHYNRAACLYELQRFGESVLDYVVPHIGVRWGDTVNLSALDPRHLIAARSRLGVPFSRLLERSGRKRSPIARGRSPPDQPWTFSPTSTHICPQTATPNTAPASPRSTRGSSPKRARISASPPRSIRPTAAAG